MIPKIFQHRLKDTIYFFLFNTLTPAPNARRFTGQTRVAHRWYTPASIRKNSIVTKILTFAMQLPSP